MSCLALYCCFITYHTPEPSVDGQYSGQSFMFLCDVRVVFFCLRGQSGLFSSSNTSRSSQPAPMEHDAVAVFGHSASPPQLFPQWVNILFSNAGKAKHPVWLGTPQSKNKQRLALLISNIISLLWDMSTIHFMKVTDVPSLCASIRLMLADFLFMQFIFNTLCLGDLG